MLLHGFFVKGLRLDINDCKGVPGTLAQAGAESVAVFLSDELRFTVNNLDGPLGAGRHAKTAAVASLLIDPDDFPLLFHFLLMFPPPMLNVRLGGTGEGWVRVTFAYPVFCFVFSTLN